MKGDPLPEVEGEILEPHIFAALDKAVFRQNFGGYRRRAKLKVEDGRLLVDGEPVPEEHCVSGYVQPVPEDDSAHLCLLDADHHIRVDATLPSALHAERMLEHLGLPTDRMAVPIIATWPAGAIVAYALFLFAFTSVAATYQTLWLAIALALPLFIAALALMRASRHPFIIAPDGIVVERFGKRELIAYESIAEVEREGDSGILLTMQDGSERRFTFEVSQGSYVLQVTLYGYRFGGRGANKNEAVVDIIEAHMAARAGGGRERLGERLRRGGRSLERWLRDVDRMARGDYRGDSPTDEQLWRVVEDGAEEASARAAAARLLGPKDPERLRIVADNTASPKLRIAIEAVDGDEEAQREALAELET